MTTARSVLQLNYPKPLSIYDCGGWGLFGLLGDVVHRFYPLHLQFI